MRRPLTLLYAGLFALTLIGGVFLMHNSPASAAPIPGAPITYCADPDTDPSMDTGAGTMITCDTKVTNRITAINPISGVPSGTSVVRVTECIGPANGRLDPNDLTCTTVKHTLVGLVNHVKQCNYVGYGGGNVLECDVEVINRWVGVTPRTIRNATVHQCDVPQYAGLDKTGCDPYPANTTNANITQCNDSSYGGGQEDFNCIATGNTRTATLRVTVNQCNNSNHGGGSWLNCSASLSNVLVGAAPTPTPTLAPGATPTGAGSTPAPTLAPGATPTAAGSTPAPTAPVVPGVTPGPLPDTSIPNPLTPQPVDPSIPLLMGGLFVLALALSKIYFDRRVRATAKVR